MSAALKRIRAAVATRTEGSCEACGSWIGEGGESGHLDHFWGRGKGRPRESERNCWLLCVPCDADRTTNTPSAEYWLTRFARHARDFGYAGELARAESRLVFVKVRAELAAPRVVTP